MKLILAALALAALPTPGDTPDTGCSPGASLGEIATLIESKGGTMIDVVPVNGQGFNQVLIADYAGGIVVGTFMLGCAVSNPLVLGPSIARTGA